MVVAVILTSLMLLFVKQVNISAAYRNTPLMVILITVLILIGIYGYISGESRWYLPILMSILSVIIVIVRRFEDRRG